jgi:hypothetical protein
VVRCLENGRDRDFSPCVEARADLTPASDGTGGGGGCSDSRPENCHPCRNGGTCGWVQDVFLGG